MVAEGAGKEGCLDCGSGTVAGREGEVGYQEANPGRPGEVQVIEAKRVIFVRGSETHSAMIAPLKFEPRARSSAG